jgi:hypothetical protein
MPPRPEVPGRIRRSPLRPPAFALLALLSIPLSAAGQEISYMDPGFAGKRAKTMLAAGGLELPVVGGETVQPQLAGYVDLPGELQAGIKLRLDFLAAESPYDLIPQGALHLRKVWLNDQDTSSVRNSEYISLSAGAYAAYDFRGDRIGARPFGGVTLGKYWMPFADQPYGLDLSLELTRYFSGHPPGKPVNHFLSASVSLFRAFPAGSP